MRCFQGSMFLRRGIFLLAVFDRAEREKDSFAGYAGSSIATEKCTKF